MAEELIKALVLRQQDGQVQAAVEQLREDDLPDGSVLVRVAYSDLNYKDGLAVTGTGKVVRSYPMVPGIDLAGTVERSSSDAYKPGDRVVLTGWGIGEQHWGGYAQLARVKDEWLVPLPQGLELEHSMAIGTAGFTAMLCVMALEEYGLPRDGEVVVTGASGGVGSVAVAILANLGYHVVASTGRAEEHEYLKALGAKDIIDRSELSAASNRPLESQRWSGAVDTVGGDTLAGLLRTTRYRCAVAACGNAGGAALNTTVFPFILRAVALLGVESVTVPQPRRREAWARLARELPKEAIELMMQVKPLEQVPELSRQIVQAKVRGRVVIDVNG